LGDRGIGVQFSTWEGNFFPKVSKKTVWSSHPPIHLGPWVLSPGGESPGREAVHFAKVKKEWRWDSTPPYVFMVCKAATIPLFKKKTRIRK